MSHAIPSPLEVLVDRIVRIEDELAEFIHQRGAPSLFDNVCRAVEGIPEWEREATMDREMHRYLAEVEAPAAAALRACKASRPPAVKKVVAPWSGDDDDALYREAVEGIEPVFQHADPPGLTSMALRVSWAPRSDLRRIFFAAFISSINRNLLVLYVGKYRPVLSGHQGFYLVYDAKANSVAIIPPLSPRAVNMFSHGSIGTGVAILRHHGASQHGKFAALVELLRRKESGRTSNAATLFIWLSSVSAPSRWTQKELVLPLPVDGDRFFADSVFSVGNKGLCWVDLLRGILICEDILSDNPEFRFIELPTGTPVSPGRFQGGDTPETHRYMSRDFIRGHEVLRFVTMDGYGQSQDHSLVTLTMWTLQLVFDEMPDWEKGTSFCYGELRADPTQEVPLLMPSYPVLSMLADNVVYITVSEPCNKLLKATDERCLLRINMKDRQILSSFKLPPGSGLTPMYMFVSIFPSYRLKISHDQDQRGHEEESGRMKQEAHVLPPSSGHVPRAFSDRRCFRSFPPLLEMSALGSPGSSSSLEPSTSSVGDWLRCWTREEWNPVHEV